MDPRFIARVLGGLFMVPGLIWGLGQVYVAGRLESHLSARSAAEEAERAQAAERELG
jgi:hypothetical protein